jgi:hypothetical protein
MRLTLGGSPTAHLSVKVHSDNLGALQLPGKTGHDVDGIGTTDTTGDHTETSGVGGVRVGTDHHQTGNSVVLEDDLVDNTRTGLPETDSVLLNRTLDTRQIKRIHVTRNSPWHKKWPRSRKPPC